MVDALDGVSRIAMLRGLTCVVVARVVIRQLRDMVIEGLGVYRFQRGTSSLVQRPAVFIQDEFICDVRR